MTQVRWMQDEESKWWESLQRSETSRSERIGSQPVHSLPPVPFWAEVHPLSKISFSWNRKLLFSWCQVHFGPNHRGCSSPAVVYNRTVLDLKAGLQFNEQVYIGPEYTGRLSNVSYAHLTFNSAYLWIVTRTYGCSQWWKKS